MQKYFLGLDIGTNSCGWAVTDEKYNLLRARGKDLWGVRLFEEAQTAADRRLKRTNRRRRDRQKLKLSWVRDIFSDEISKVDPNFLTRTKYSSLWEEDKLKMSNLLKSKDSLFNGQVDGKNYTDKDYFNEYPTIFHLRKELTVKPARDIRFLYLAVHNIIKHRGHFLFNGEFGENSDLENLLNAVITEGVNVFEDASKFNLIPNFSKEKVESIISILKEKKGIRYTKLKFCEVFGAENKIDKAFANCLVDGKLNLNQFFDNSFEIDKIDFSEENIEEIMEELSNVLSEEQYSLLVSIKNVFSVLNLKSFLGSNEFICDAMVETFDLHKKQLNDFKKFIKKFYSDKYYDIFRNSRYGNNADANVGYSQYINGNLINGKKQVVNLNISDRSREEFYKYIKKILSEEPKNISDVEEYTKQKQEILFLMENNNFLIKQRSKANAVFPNKLYEKELVKILEVNSTKFKFLTDVDKEYGLTNVQKLLQILNFRVPYFVGPIGSSECGQKHNWVERESSVDFKPWTLDKIINFDKAEDAFINKMTNKCTYFNDKDVLPKHSLIYSKFMVLNELNKLKLDGNNISVDLKQKIFDALFKNEAKVTIKKLKDFLIAEGLFSKQEIGNVDIGGIDKEFTNNYSVYVKFSNKFGKEFVDNNIEIIEKIIKYITIISDKNRLEKRLANEFSDIFNEEKIKFFKGMNFSDWGKLSREFLVDFKFANKETGEITTVIDELWNTNQNLQQIIYNSNYTLHEQMFKKKNNNIKQLVYSDIENLYCSPAVKRGIWQTLKICKEVVEVLGCMPEKIFVEVSRQDGVKGDDGRKSSRKKNLEQFYKSKDFKNNVYLTAHDIAQLLEELNHCEISNLRSEKLYLYFLQAGKCAYSGQNINIKDIFNDNLYDVDHIIPQSIIKDDSISNKVLVKSELNRVKDNTYPLPYEIIQKQKNFWQFLLENKLIDKVKYERLIRTAELCDEELGEFVARQLVETNQTTKAVIDCLKLYVDKPNKIIYSKAAFISNFRKEFNILKSRTANDFHHAQDAYLNIVVGNVLNSRFTDDPKNFYKQNNKNKYLSRNINKLFTGVVYSPLTNKPIWDVSKDIERIKKACNKNSPLISEMSYADYNGAFYKETIHKSKKNCPKSEASIALKGDDKNPLSNVERYGGYNDLFNAYFMLIESKNKKGKLQKTIESVPILAVRKYIGKGDYEQNILKYVAAVNNLVEPKVLINKINIKSTLQIGGGEYLLGGKSGSKYVLHNANQMFVDAKTLKYIKILENYKKLVANKMDNGLEITNDKIIVSKAMKKNNTELILTKEQNLMLYKRFIDLLELNIYKEMQLNTTFLPKLKEGEMTFKNLQIQDQVDVLFEILKRITRGAGLANLAKLNFGSALGSLTINKNITGKKIFLIQRSVTGLFEKKVKL